MPVLETPQGTNKLLPITALFGESADGSGARLTTIYDIRSYSSSGAGFAHSADTKGGLETTHLRIRFQDALKLVMDAHQEGTYVDLTDERLERDGLFIKHEQKPAPSPRGGRGGIEC